MHFGGPDPRKSSSRVHETLILIKSPFSSQGHFLMQNGTHKAPKMDPTGHSKSTKKLMHFLLEQKYRFSRKNGVQGDPTGIPNSRHFGVFSRLLARTPPKKPNGPKMCPKWSQNGVQKERRLSENGAHNGWRINEH